MSIWDTISEQFEEESKKRKKKEKKDGKKYKTPLLSDIMDV